MPKLTRYDLVITNPPFFDSREAKETLQKKNFEAKEVEIVCQGGELEFISKMIREAIDLNRHSILYCAYIGRKETVKALMEAFRSNSNLVIFSETLYQGTTARWLLGWRLRAVHIDIYSSKLDTHHGSRTTFPCEERDLHEDN